ncbi:MAG: hypothetical protein ACK4XK_03000 [Casimicrobiaceae bacterium]
MHPTAGKQNGWSTGCICVRYWLRFGKRIFRALQSRTFSRGQNPMSKLLTALIASAFAAVSFAQAPAAPAAPAKAAEPAAPAKAAEPAKAEAKNAAPEKKAGNKKSTKKKGKKAEKKA